MKNSESLYFECGQNVAIATYCWDENRVLGLTAWKNKAVSSEAKPHDWKKAHEAYKNGFESVKKCETCDGSGRDNHDEKRPCDDCDGLGYELDED